MPIPNEVEMAMQPGSFGQLADAIALLRNVGQQLISDAPLEAVGEASGPWLEKARSFYLWINESKNRGLLNDCHADGDDSAALCVALQSPARRYELLTHLHSISITRTLSEALRRNPRVYHAVAALSSLITAHPEFEAIVNPIGVDFGAALQELERLEAQFPAFVERQGYSLVDIAGGLQDVHQRADFLTTDFLLNRNYDALDQAASLLERAINFLSKDLPLAWPIHEWWRIEDGDSLHAMLTTLQTFSQSFKSIGQEFLQASLANGFARSSGLPVTAIPRARDKRLGFVVYLPTPDLLLPTSASMAQQEVAHANIGHYIAGALAAWPNWSEMSVLRLRAQTIKQWQTERRVAENIDERSNDLIALALTEIICRGLDLNPEVKDVLLIAVLGLIRGVRK